MSKLKRVLGFFMAIVIMMSTLSVVAQGRASYYDDKLTTYDDLDQPVITYDQACTMVLDSVDVLLKDMETIDLSVIGELRLNSINNALDDLYKLLGNALLPMAGELNNLERGPIKSDQGRRTAGENSEDTRVIYSLMAFLGHDKNRTVLRHLVDGTIGLGIVGSFVDLDLDIPKMILDALAKPAYKRDPDGVPSPLPSADIMIQKLLDDVVRGKEDPENPGTYTGFAKDLLPYVGLNNATKTYDFIEELLKQAYNKLVIPLANNELKFEIRKICGLTWDDAWVDNPTLDVDDTGLNKFGDLVNVNYTVPTFNFPAGESFLASLNDMLAQVINTIVKYDPVEGTGFQYPENGNDNLKANLMNVAKYVMTDLGPDLFPSFVELKDPAVVNAMTDPQEIISYVLRVVMNSFIDTIYIPDEAETLIDVAWYAFYQLLATELPGENYQYMPKTKAGVYGMLGDLLASVINEKIDMVDGPGVIPYDKQLDTTQIGRAHV